ncbi:hypothetical protein B4U80_11405 [Leptotrombidium deliense]|uniref:Uncharacterized protein n=1 Tax=Leptotrombidium deliense TaxID=299467 RepID=A0A443RXX2_9ACAR|nr:hypothetical protein B4U80_11405 [Leptotrombidium deliense]
MLYCGTKMQNYQTQEVRNKTFCNSRRAICTYSCGFNWCLANVRRLFILLNNSRSCL